MVRIYRLTGSHRHLGRAVPVVRPGAAMLGEADEIHRVAVVDGQAAVGAVDGHDAVGVVEAEVAAHVAARLCHRLPRRSGSSRVRP
nr:hypothetical protein [Streptomyces griseus]